MWQALYDELQSNDFALIAVALDTEAAARPWIEQASVAYPALIDAEHRLGELYGFVNVPEAAWIDEAGRIVRPPETAGAYEAFRSRNRETNEVPAEELAKKASAQKLYLDAVRDWVANGADSRFVMAADEARRHVRRLTPEMAEAHVRFRLAAHLFALGRIEEAGDLMAAASASHPDSWSIWRQGAPKNNAGLAAEAGFWERVDRLGDARYYPPPPMDGMP